MGLENWGIGKHSSLWGSGSDPILNQVLECSSDDPVIGTAISAISDVHLLEGSWLVALSDRNTSPQLIVFNTLLPQQDAKSWRILQLPRLPCGDYFFSSRYGDWPAEFPGFLVDPAQMSFVMSSQKSALVIPVEPLIGRYLLRVQIHSSNGTTGGSMS